MEKNYLIVNTGSASKKYALYRGNARVFFAHFEKEGKSFVATIESDATDGKRPLQEKDFTESLPYILKEIAGAGIWNDPKAEIAGIGFRIVAPGKYFSEHRIIDAEYLKILETEREEAPLHITPMLQELETVARVFPDTPIVGVSDSAFHSSIPEHVYTYGISYDVAEKNEIRKFGYHGSSFASVVRKAEEMFGRMPARMIVCHLGSGSSITAIKDGKSVDTSMGLSPLEGVPMATRVGDIDPGAVIRLCQKMGGSSAELEKYFFTKCGLFGMSGKSSDTRDLLALEEQGDVKAKLALDVAAYRIKKYIGSYMAALDGLAALVFSATIGERSCTMRERICRDLGGLGIVLDEQKNNATVSRDGFIHKEGSAVSVAVVTTDEMREIALETAKVLK